MSIRVAMIRSHAIGLWLSLLQLRAASADLRPDRRLVSPHNYTLLNIVCAFLHFWTFWACGQPIGLPMARSDPSATPNCNFFTLSYTFGPFGFVAADRLASNIICPLHRLRLMKCIAAPVTGRIPMFVRPNRPRGRPWVLAGRNALPTAKRGEDVPRSSRRARGASWNLSS